MADKGQGMFDGKYQFRENVKEIIVGQRRRRWRTQTHSYIYIYYQILLIRLST